MAEISETELAEIAERHEFEPCAAEPETCSRLSQMHVCGLPRSAEVRLSDDVADDRRVPKKSAACEHCGNWRPLDDSPLCLDCFATGHRGYKASCAKCKKAANDELLSQPEPPERIVINWPLNPADDKWWYYPDQFDGVEYVRTSLALDTASNEEAARAIVDYVSPANVPTPTFGRGHEEDIAAYERDQLISRIAVALSAKDAVAIEIVKAKRDEWEQSSCAEMGNQRLIEKTRINTCDEIIIALEVRKGKADG